MAHFGIEIGAFLPLSRKSSGCAKTIQWHHLVHAICGERYGQDTLHGPRQLTCLNEPMSCSLIPFLQYDVNGTNQDLIAIILSC